jgi:cysteine sulfinate desulfinase/cysteine desulfurase-like protein
MAQGAVRVSLGKGNNVQEVREFLQALQGQLVRMKQFMAMAA